MKTDNIKNTLLVFSGKGGVGKSTVATNLALSLANRGLKVGLLDIDIHGPNLAIMLGKQNERILLHEEGQILPIEVNKNLLLVSMAYFISSIDTAIIWRGPAKMKIIGRFINDVVWGDLDWLIIDSPPGTGDEPLSIAQLLPTAGAIIVTTPQDVSLLDSKKAINFAMKLKLKIFGMIENMSGFKCPHCNQTINLFKTGNSKKVAEQYNIPFLGSIPIDPTIASSGDDGKPFIMDEKSEITKNFQKIVDNILRN